MNTGDLDPASVAARLASITATRPELGRLPESVMAEKIAAARAPEDPPGPARLDPEIVDGRTLATFVLGCGRGAVARALTEGLRHTSAATVVVVVEPEPARLLASLAIDDWTAVLAEPRVRFAVGPDIGAAVAAAIPEAVDPLLERGLAPGVGLLPGEAGARSASIRKAFDQAALRVLTAAKRRCDEQAAVRPLPVTGPVLPAGPWRIFSSTGSETTALRQLAPSILAAAARAGHHTDFHLRDAGDPFANSTASRASHDADPDLVLSFLKPGRGVIPWRRDFPSLVLASSHPRLHPIETFDWSARDLVVVTEPAFAEPYLEQGVSPLQRPLATDVPDLDALAAEPMAEDVLVVGNIPDGRSVARGLAPSLLALIGELADDWVRHPTATPEALLATTNISGEPRFMNTVRLALGYEATRRRRIGTVVSLAKAGLRVRVHGDDAWGPALAGTAAEGAWKGWLDAERRFTLFHAAPVSVNVNSFAALGSLNMRSFSIPAAAGLLIADDRPPLRTAFEIGTEVLCFRDLDELPDLAADAVRDRDRRDAIAAAGRARVERDHSWDAWWAWAEARLRARFGA